jgi:hypothetical protein
MKKKGYTAGMLTILFLLASFFVSCYQKGTSGSTKNKLTNTTWKGQRIESDGSIDASLVFGENGFKLTYGDKTISGTYEINGDEVILNHNLGPYNGVILGNTLTWEILVARYEFQRVN